MHDRIRKLVSRAFTPRRIAEWGPVVERVIGSILGELDGREGFDVVMDFSGPFPVEVICEIVGVPCTHSDPLTMAMTLDKSVAKRIVASAGVPTPAFLVVESPADLRRVDMRYPLFVKPLSEGSSMGIDRRSRRCALGRWQRGRLRAGDVPPHHR